MTEKAFLKNVILGEVTRLKKILPTIVAILFFATIAFLFYKFGSKSKFYDTRTDDLPIKSGCEYRDGSHQATVDYYNPDTGHSASYDLQVEVRGCEVVTIYFPRGGWLDDSHITPAELDNDGNALIEDDKGRSYRVHIED